MDSSLYIAAAKSKEHNIIELSTYRPQNRIPHRDRSQEDQA